MDVISLDEPKASPAETLRAYSFFHKEHRVLFEAIVFCVAHLSLTVGFWCGQDLVERIIPPAAFVSAAVYLVNVLKRNGRRRRLRLSLWEAEIEEFCVKPQIIAFATIAPIVAIIAWLAVLLVESIL